MRIDPILTTHQLVGAPLYYCMPHEICFQLLSYLQCQVVCIGFIQVRCQYLYRVASPASYLKVFVINLDVISNVLYVFESKTLLHISATNLNYILLTQATFNCKVLRIYYCVVSLYKCIFSCVWLYVIDPNHCTIFNGINPNQCAVSVIF